MRIDKQQQAPPNLFDLPQNTHKMTEDGAASPVVICGRLNVTYAHKTLSADSHQPFSNEYSIPKRDTYNLVCETDIFAMLLAHLSVNANGTATQRQRPTTVVSNYIAYIQQCRCARVQ